MLILDQLGTSIGLAVTSTIANFVSGKFNKKYPNLNASDPAVLMAGFRAAGWVCCGTIAVSLVIALVGMRGVGLVGQRHPEDADNSGERKHDGDVEMAVPRLPSPPTPCIQEPDTLDETRSLDTLTTGDPVFTTLKVVVEPKAIADGI